jgi:hypothetical protein
MVCCYHCLLSRCQSFRTSYQVWLQKHRRRTPTDLKKVNTILHGMDEIESLPTADGNNLTSAEGAPKAEILDDEFIMVDPAPPTPRV